LQYVSAPEPVFYVLLYPGFQISTAWAYGNLKMPLTFEEKYINFIASLKDTGVLSKACYPCIENDFSRLVETHHPAVKDIRERLTALGAFKASLSGSGSTVYGIFERREEAEAAAEKMRESGWGVFLCRPVG